MGFSQTLLVYVLVCVHLGVSQPFLRLRPSPSDHLPVPGLIEEPDPEYDPREQDLAERTLRKKLGSNFDPNFMSISSPMLVNLTAQDNQVKLQGPMPNDIKKLDLTETPYGKRVKVGKKARRKFLQWLWTYTHCPVVYTWKDLGVRFWPRYIKEGNCFSERSCSFPEGMSCKPVKSINKIFLRCAEELQRFTRLVLERFNGNEALLLLDRTISALRPNGAELRLRPVKPKDGDIHALTLGKASEVKGH
ncbi:hypothetical protein Q5P01_023234 [Channa striata]|uniref:Noggin n=1 Tax=Channa striata TaxID=64152 RepID=A0AA88IUI1_CHASR|nr:hypothetical protein Q5P01_023234 [Channa striata]